MEVPGFEMGDGVWLGEGAEVHPDAAVVGPAVIGENCRIEAGVRLGHYTVLGTNVRVRADADLERVVVHDNSYLGDGVRLRGATIGRSCDLRAGVRCEEGVVLGDECFIGEHAVLASGVKVYPFKTVEAGAVINSSIVWESRGSRVAVRAGGRRRPRQRRHHPRARHTGGDGLRDHAEEGQHDRDVAGLEPVGPHAQAGDDGGRQRRRCQRARPRGGVGAGHPVHHPPPERVGGLTIRLVEGDPQSCVIRFFDTTGADLSEDAQRKVERLVGREDFRRVFPAEIGDIGFPPRALEQYSAALEATVDIEAIRAARFKVVVDYAFGSTSFVMPNVLAKLGADVLGRQPLRVHLGAHGLRPPSPPGGGGRLVRGLRRPPGRRARPRR